MAQMLYVNPDPKTQDRATALGCGWVPTVPLSYAGTAPCVCLGGAGKAIVLPDDGTLTAAQVATAVQSILDAEAQQSQAAAVLAGNQATLQSRASAAIAANATFLALASPTNADVLAQVRLVTRECTAVIRLLLGKLDDTSGT